MEELARWAQAKGCRATGIEVRLGTSERGLFASRRVETGSPVLAVPLSACLHAERPPNSIPSLAKSAPWPARLAFSLLVEAESGSGYVDSLPAAAELEEHHPLLMEPLRFLEASRELSYGPAEARASSLIVAADEWGSHLHAGAGGGAFHWAFATAMSRTIGLQGITPEEAGIEGGFRVRDGDGTSRVMAPLVDLINHAEGEVANVEWDVYGEKGSLELVVTAKREIEEGEELTATYGDRSTDEFWAHYGFVPRAQGSRDDAVLFHSHSHMVRWLEAHVGGGGGFTGRRKAMEAAERAGFRASPSEAAKEKSLKALSGERLVDARALAAAESMCGGRGAAEKAIARRCAEVAGMLEREGEGVSDLPQHLADARALRLGKASLLRARQAELATQ